MTDGDSDERIYASILRENETWAERCQELAAENLALRLVLDDVASAIRDAQRGVFPRLSDTDSLDLAWAEAETALAISVGLSLTRGDGVYWAAWGDLEINRPTSAAALRALTDAIRAKS